MDYSNFNYRKKPLLNTRFPSTASESGMSSSEHNSSNNDSIGRSSTHRRKLRSHRSQMNAHTKKYKVIPKSKVRSDISSSDSQENIDTLNNCPLTIGHMADTRKDKRGYVKFPCPSTNVINCRTGTNNHMKNQYSDCKSVRSSSCYFNPDDSNSAFGVRSAKSRKLSELDMISLKSNQRFYPEEALQQETKPEIRFEMDHRNRYDSIAGVSEHASEVRSLSSYSYSSLSTPEPPVSKNPLVAWLKPIFQSIISKIEDPRSNGGQLQVGVVFHIRIRSSRISL